MEKGVALVIRRAGVPVVPVAIHGSFEAWPKGSWIFRPHRVKVKYGKAIDFDGKKGEQIVRELEGKLKGLLAELRRGKIEI